MSNIRFNEAALKRVVAKATERVGREYSAQLNSLSRQYKGKSLAEVKAALVKLHRERGGSVSEPELTRLAKQLVAGGKIDIRTR